MLRVFCQSWDGGKALPALDDEEIHHLVRVRRVRAGEPVELLNGRGGIASCRVVEAGSKRVDLELLEVRKIAAPALQVQLLVALPKGKTFPAVLHKAVELGVSRITPLVTEHSEVPPSKAGQKQERWESILVEALKQSGNPWMPQLDPPTGLNDALKGTPDAQRLCAALQPDARPLWELLTSELNAEAEGTIQVYVGPEGDFSGGEYAVLREARCRFVSLGPVVLKVETAASLLAGTLSLWRQTAGKASANRKSAPGLGASS